jgi:hypothetical protein
MNQNLRAAQNAAHLKRKREFNAIIEILKWASLLRKGTLKINIRSKSSSKGAAIFDNFQRLRPAKP